MTAKIEDKPIELTVHSTKSTKNDVKKEKFPKIIILFMIFVVFQVFSGGGFRAVLMIYLKRNLFLYKNLIKILFNKFIILIYLKIFFHLLSI